MNNESSSDRTRTEAGLAKRFMSAMERKAKQLELQKEFKLSDQERKVLMEVCTSNMLEGVAAGVVTFLVLRRVRAMYYNYLRRQVTNNNKSTGPNAFNSPFQQLNPPTVRNNEAFQADQFKAINFMENAQNGTNSDMNLQRSLFNAFTILFDSMVAFYIAIAVSTRTPETVLHKVSEIPLIAGQSTVSDEICPVFVQELRNIYLDRQNQRLTNDEEKALDNPQGPVFKCLLDFCSNCQRRAAYEELLRRENGLNANDRVIIPPPGVPSDIPFSDLMISSDTKGVWDDGTSQSSPDFYDAENNFNITNNDNEWAESFVSDQEEDQRKRR